MFDVPWMIVKGGMAEGVGFEPTRAFALPVFKTGAINHSTTPPERCRGNFGTERVEQDSRLRVCALFPRLLGGHPERSEGPHDHDRIISYVRMGEFVRSFASLSMTDEKTSWTCVMFM